MRSNKDQLCFAGATVGEFERPRSGVGGGGGGGRRRLRYLTKNNEASRGYGTVGVDGTTTLLPPPPPLPTSLDCSCCSGSP